MTSFQRNHSSRYLDVHRLGGASQCALGYVAYASPTPTPPPDQALVARALWFAGAIAYRRAFTSGRGHLVAGGSRLKIKDAWTTDQGCMDDAADT